MQIKIKKLVNRLKDFEKKFEGNWDWVYALRGYAIFSALIVTVASLVDHFITAVAIMLIMNIWVVLGTFSVSSYLRDDLTKEERILANIKNTFLFTAGLLVPLAAMISGTGLVFSFVFAGVLLLSFLPSIAKHFLIFVHSLLQSYQNRKENSTKKHLLNDALLVNKKSLLYLKETPAKANLPNTIDKEDNSKIVL